MSDEKMCWCVQITQFKDALTSVGMVQDHQLSVCFSDLHFVGSGTKGRKKPSVELMLSSNILQRGMHSQTNTCLKNIKERRQGSPHTWRLRLGQPLFLSFLVQTLLYNTLLQKPAAEHASQRLVQSCTEHGGLTSSLFLCRTVLGKLWRACFTWGSMCFMACMTYRPGRREDRNNRVYVYFKK